MYLGKGSVFSEECVLLDKPSLYTVRCNSAYGEIIAITNVEYYRRIKNIPETVKQIAEICEKKAEQVAKTLLTENTYQSSDKDQRGTFYAFAKNSVKAKEIEIGEMQNNYELELKYAKDGSRHFHSHAPIHKKKGNPLLNKKELDYRETMREIVDHYPAVKQQRYDINKKARHILRDIEKEQGIEHNSVKDPKREFKYELAKSLAASPNKRELINIMKRRLVDSTGEKADQYISLLDEFLNSKEVRKFNMNQKKNYTSSKLADAIIEQEGLNPLFNYVQTNAKLAREKDRMSSSRLGRRIVSNQE